MKCCKYFLVVSLAVFVLGLMTPAFGQIVSDKSTVIGTPHDTLAGGNGCLNCHVPHQATQRGRTLLWNVAFSTVVFGTYTSDTMDSVAAEIGDATYSDTNAPTGAKAHSVLCMSCHDGVTSPLLIPATDMHAVGNLVNSDGLRNDHPVNMAFDPVADAGLNPIATVTATNVRLFTDGANDTVQCASCHDPHGAAGFDPYLRVDNSVGSGLCVTCHK